MKASLHLFCLLAFLVFLASCHTTNTSQVASVRRFAITGKDVSELPYKILYDYYTIKFQRKQLLPENYVTGDTERVELDELAETVISRLEEIKGEYDENLSTASEIKTVYDLLDTYFTSLEAISGDNFYKDFKKKSTDMGNKMNNLVTKLNTYPAAKITVPLSPGDFLASFATFHGRNELKAKQANMVEEYITEADTLVQAINIHYQEIELPIMNSWFNEERRMIRDQFKRSIAPYLQNANRHPDSIGSIVAFEFFSKINPVYYQLTDEISRDQLLVKQTSTMMSEMAKTHGELKTLFNSNGKTSAVREEIEELRGKISALKEFLNIRVRENPSFYNLTQHEESIKNTNGR